MRAGPGAVGLGSSSGAEDHAGGDPASREPAREADWNAVLNPGGPGVSGVGDVKDPFVSRLLDEAGGGRFDVVSWDPRGVGASTHVRCFRNELSGTRFWDGLTVPTTAPASRRYLAKAIGYARGCAQLSGSLLAHISTADTVRDLDYLRVLLHQRRLTYLGWSYGTFLGQTYANMFPGRVRAMVLDGVVDAVSYVRSKEAFLENAVSPTDAVFERFEALCQQAGPVRCALAGHGSVSARVNALLRRVRRASIPAPTAAPPGRLTYSDLITAFFPEMRNPGTWPDFARDLEAAVNGDGSALLTKARQFPPTAGQRPGAGRDRVRRQPDPQPPKRVAQGHRPAHSHQPLKRPGARLVAMGTVRRLARSQRRSLHRTLERPHQASDPRRRHAI